MLYNSIVYLLPYSLHTLYHCILNSAISIVDSAGFAHWSHFSAISEIYVLHKCLISSSFILHPSSLSYLFNFQNQIPTPRGNERKCPKSISQPHNPAPLRLLPKPSPPSPPQLTMPPLETSTCCSSQKPILVDTHAPATLDALLVVGIPLAETNSWNTSIPRLIWGIHRRVPGRRG